jgi:ABC-type transport system substrate-binding protein
MIRNEDYYGQLPKLQRFQLHVFDSTDSILSSLSKSEVNAAVGLSSVDLPRVDTKKYRTIAQPTQSGIFALLNVKSQVLQDVNVRKALQLATNTSSIRSKLAKGTPPLDIPIIPNLLENNTAKAPDFNLEAAKNTFAAAGWSLDASKVWSKNGQQLKLTVITLKNTELERVLETIAGQWRTLGVVVDTKSVDPDDNTVGVVQNIIQPRAYDVLLYQLNIGGDPDVYAYWHTSQTSIKGLNLSNYSNAITDDALLSARTRIEPNLRNAKYLTFVRQWLNDVPAIGLYQSTIDYVASKSTHTFNTTNTLVSPVDRYADISEWGVGNQSVYKTP